LGEGEKRSGVDNYNYERQGGLKENFQPKVRGVKTLWKFHKEQGRFPLVNTLGLGR